MFTINQRRNKIMASDNMKFTQVQFIETVLDIANNGWANSIIGEDQKNWVCGRIMSRLPDDWVSKLAKVGYKCQSKYFM